MLLPNCCIIPRTHSCFEYTKNLLLTQRFKLHALGYVEVQFCGSLSVEMFNMSEWDDSRVVAVVLLCHMTAVLFPFWKFLCLTVEIHDSVVVCSCSDTSQMYYIPKYPSLYKAGSGSVCSAQEHQLYC